MDFEIRPISAEELPAFLRTTWAAFSDEPSPEDYNDAWEKEELDRTLAVLDGDRMVGAARAYSYPLTLPGLNPVTAAAVTSVGVLPTHRRRGVLTEMMRRQLADARARGECLAMLLASESLIYGRFGYGWATSAAGYEIDTRHARFLRPLERPGRITMITKDEATQVLPAMLEKARLLRPGMVGVSAGWWDHYFRDPPDMRGGASGLIFVTHESTPGDIDGVVAYRVKENWDLVHGSVLNFRNILATNEDAHAALWQYLLSVDLVVKVVCDLGPVDEPLRWRLKDPRRLRTTRVRDWLWLRVLDIPAALTARGYLQSDRLVLEVVDRFCPENDGCYTLEAGPEGATCSPSGDNPDLSLGVDDVGSLLLGGVSATDLMRAGRVSEVSAGAAARADRLFRAEQAPFATHNF